MKTLTINTLAKKPRYGKHFSFRMFRAPPIEIRSAYDPPGVTQYVQGLSEPPVMTIEGEGLHSRLSVSEEVRVRLLGDKERATLTGFVKSQMRMFDEQQTEIVVNRTTMCKKRKGRWKIVSRN